MFLLKNSLRLLILLLCTTLSVQFCIAQEASTWAGAKDTAQYVVKHPLKTIKKGAKMGALATGAVLASTVFAYYVGKEVKVIADKINESQIGSQASMLAGPIKKMVILSGLMLLAYKCGRELYTFYDGQKEAAH